MVACHIFNQVHQFKLFKVKEDMDLQQTMAMEIQQVECIIHHLIQDDKGDYEREWIGGVRGTQECGLLQREIYKITSADKWEQ
jgi:hypothetical protein